jgi:hypothetical protein
MEAIKGLRLPVTCFALVAILLSQCKSTTREYPQKVGEIVFDPKLDDANFFICNEGFIPEGYQVSTSYKGEAWAILTQLKAGFQYNDSFIGSGYVTIRFVVNCKGEAGRYRILQVDENYQPTEFSQPLLHHLLSLTKGLTQWNAGKYRDQPRDSYEHVIFKIERGQLALITL